MVAMANDCLWRPRAPKPPAAPQVPHVVEVIREAEPAPPRFNRRWLDEAYERARREIALAIESEDLPEMTPYDPRLDVLKGYFIAYAEGVLPAERVEELVQVEMARLLGQVQYNVNAVILACEIAKAGFLA